MLTCVIGVNVNVLLTDSCTVFMPESITSHNGMSIVLKGLKMGTTFLGHHVEDILYTRFLLESENFTIYMSENVNNNNDNATNLRVTQIVPTTSVSLDLAVPLDNGDKHGPDCYLVLKSPAIVLTIDTHDMMGFLRLVSGNFGQPIPSVDGMRSLILALPFLFCASTWPFFVHVFFFFARLTEGR